MSSPPPPPPLSDPAWQDNRAAELIGLTWTWCGLSLVFVGMRMYTRLKLKHNFWWDDFMILFTMVRQQAERVALLCI